MIGGKSEVSRLRWLQDVKNDLQKMGDKACARADWEIVTKGTMALRGLQSQNVEVLITKIKHDSKHNKQCNSTR
jgi:hypothetical protein